jgi:hypothetical protein
MAASAALADTHCQDSLPFLPFSFPFRTEYSKAGDFGFPGGLAGSTLSA